MKILGDQGMVVAKVLIPAMIVAGLVIGVFAHGGEDHGTAGPAASSVATIGGVIQIPKESQFTFEITTEPVIERVLESTQGATGVVVPKPGSRAEVYAPQPGRIKLQRALEPGDYVNKGQALFSVEQVLGSSERLTLERDLIEANADFQEAQRDYSRKKSLEGVVAGKEIELAAIRLKSAKERSAALEKVLRQGTTPLTVTAPISGRLTMMDLTNGEFVEISKQLLEITNMSEVWVEAAIYQKDLKGMPRIPTAIITLPSAEGSFVGTFVSEGSTVGEASKSVTLHFAVPNPNEQLKIGATANIELNLGSPKQTLAVRKSAVVSIGGVQYVFVHTQAEEFVAKQFIAGPKQNADYIEVESGLQLNDRAVVRNASILRGKLQ